ncbi:hypothetical protein M8J77_020905 [Diaphorina citri]|nr:hypothetical protein M8J77_020905 [Diaphorina citri]
MAKFLENLTPEDEGYYLTGIQCEEGGGEGGEEGEEKEDREEEEEKRKKTGRRRRRKKKKKMKKTKRGRKRKKKWMKENLGIEKFCNEDKRPRNIFC